MSLTVPCDHCGCAVLWSGGRAGRMVSCPECGDIFRMPEEALGGAEPVRMVLELIPALGMLELIEDQSGRLGGEALRDHACALAEVHGVCGRTGGTVRVAAKRSLVMGEERGEGEQREEGEDWEGEWEGGWARGVMAARHVLVVELTSYGTSFYLVVGWGELGRLPHEFFSILPGRLAHPVALRAEGMEGFGQGEWVGSDGVGGGLLAVAAERSRERLAEGTETRWFSEDGMMAADLGWVVQGVPLGPERFVHVVQTAGQGGADVFGVRWYMERQRAFYEFAVRMGVPDTHECHFPFASLAGRLLVMASDALGCRK